MLRKLLLPHTPPNYMLELFYTRALICRQTFYSFVNCKYRNTKLLCSIIVHINLELLLSIITWIDILLIVNWYKMFPAIVVAVFAFASSFNCLIFEEKRAVITISNLDERG